MFHYVQKLYPALYLGTALMAPLVALAQEDKVSPVAQNILAALNLVVTIVFILAVIVFGWGIVKLIVAAGDPGKIKEAKGFLIWGVIGIAILASIFGIIQFLQQYIGISSGTQPIQPPGVTLPVGS
ncbi:MAG: hypothetical protein A3C07_01260 [Candidatus Sungbacteria bacterium RIFCSPHIGHO2_02_FULL_47_11]|uniref:DUF4190 domain-containing protein n=1 Tax=Candidatus Sungbacteria bacterium RIFCSPHIGHO2_02_FULL_47_11 TaxID=1802270 RepID=A0A1G2KLY5_9BACT|nr:MAG: hypothetical protein A3C07_01260 [Candidatus Sungbacteria bacterium RIFCSPHIGHO2_02_FULL_47_11]